MDTTYEISTQFFREDGEDNTLNFEVTCRVADTGNRCAYLRGFLHEPGYMPNEMMDEGYFDVFDSRSSHAVDGLEILCQQQDQIMRALGSDFETDHFFGIAFLERAWIVSKLRGTGLTHRLMREAQHVLSRPDLLVMLKAHPDEADADENGISTTSKHTSADDCRKLARYYRFDKTLDLRELDRVNFPGWMVALWSDRVQTRDDRYWHCSRRWPPTGY